VLMPRIKKKILKALLDETQKSLPTVYRMIEKERARLFLPNNSKGRSTAANYLASRFTDVSKSGLTKEELDTLRNLAKIAPPIAIKSQTKPEKRIKETKMVLFIDGKLTEAFGLPKKMVKEVKIMTEVYPVLYSLENLVRYIIIRILARKYGNDWWDKCHISNDIRKSVEKRMKEEDVNRWHGKRGSHQIFYTDFNDLRSIIINNWEEFKELFPDQIWVQSRLKDVEPSRNIIAHNNPLPKREIKRIRMIMEDFRKQLKDFRT